MTGDLTGEPRPQVRAGAPAPDGQETPHTLPPMPRPPVMAPPPVPPPAPLPPRPGDPRRTVLIVVGAVAAALLVLTLMLALGFRALSRTTPTAAPSASASATAPAAAGLATGGPDLPSVLRAQADALLRGDEAGWLAPIDPARTRLVGAFRNLYATLRAMRVSGWNPHPVVSPLRPLDTPRQASVMFGYCFADPNCPEPEFLKDNVRVITAKLTYVLRGGQVVITAMALEARGGSAGPQPLETVLTGAPLSAVVGERVILAAPRAHAGRLRQLLPQAERAARIADRYAKWTPPPSRYTIYLAGAKEWQAWFGGPSGNHVDGYAIRTSTSSSDVVLDVRQTGGDVETLLRHEMGHVATLLGTDHTSYDWMAEGLAEYVAYTGRNPARVPQLGVVRRYLATGQWSGKINQPLPDDSLGRGAGYEISYLALRRLADRFGEAKMLQFVGAVLRDGDDVTDAAPRVFGKPWAQLDRDCAAYVRQIAG